MEGAELAIIMDNEKEYNKEIIMKDDGYGNCVLMQVTRCASPQCSFTTRTAKP